MPSGAIATWIPAGKSEAYSEPVAYYNDQPVYSMIVDYTAQVPTSVTGVYEASARTSVATAISNVAYSGTNLDEELKAAEETLAFEMGQ